MRVALSNNHSSFDNQVADVVSWLSNQPQYADLMERRFTQNDFPEYNSLVWEGSWVDTEASGVEPDYMSWVAEWLEDKSPVYWEDGEPWIEVHAPMCTATTKTGERHNCSR
jgi:hypothetical protein